MTTYQAIVVGTGGVGSATLFHLAHRGVHALGLDRFAPGHDRGSSHGRTRMIRQAYFEHPDYVPLVLRAYQLWHELEQRCGKRLFRKTGLLQVGPEDGPLLCGVRASAAKHALQIDALSPARIEARWPGFCVPDPLVGLFEHEAGYLRVEECVVSYLDEAVRLGAELHTNETVQSWQPDGDGVLVATDRATYRAERLIVTAGSWAGTLLASLDIDFQVLRKSMFWYATEGSHYAAQAGVPAVLYELPEGLFYSIPQIDENGIKVAEHTGGATVADPLQVDRDIDPRDLRRVTAFVEHCLPRASTTCIHHAVCLYTMTADQHFVVDRHPNYPQVAFAAGLSGHGFKFAPVLGEALADLAPGCATQLPIEFLAVNRPGLR